MGESTPSKGGEAMSAQTVDEPLVEPERFERLPYAQDWTVADLDRLPEDGHRYELIDGVVQVSPSPSHKHQVIGNRLWRLLEDASLPGFQVTTAVGVTVTDDRYLIPDVLVVRGDHVRPGDFQAEEVRLAVEVVSKSTRSMDRWHKPHLYAAGGIPVYWRIELDPLHLIAYELDTTGAAGEETEYVEVARVEAGQRFRTETPFALEFDPAELLP
jgi:Uma2 family endonuclease